MKRHTYPDRDSYVQAQIEANRRKQDWVWVRQDTVCRIAKWKGDARSILCHGTRNGAEQRYFLECYPDAEVLGTEIAPNDYPMTVQHDFHFPLEGWEGKADIVYTNSMDHTFDTLFALETWRSQLSRRGHLFIEHSDTHTERYVTRFDPLGASLEEYRELIGNIVDEIPTGNGRVLVTR